MLFDDWEPVELVVETIDGDNSIFIDSDVVDVDDDGCCGCWLRRDDWYTTVPLLLMTVELFVIESRYDWSLILLHAMDCVDGGVVRILSFCETVDVLRWCRWICCCNDGGVWIGDMRLSVGVLPVVNAVIFAKTSFLAMVGDEDGLVDGVVLAETVLLLKLFEKKNSYLVLFKKK